METVNHNQQSEKTYNTEKGASFEAVINSCSWGELNLMVTSPDNIPPIGSVVTAPSPKSIEKIHGKNTYTVESVDGANIFMKSTREKFANVAA